MSRIGFTLPIIFVSVAVFLLVASSPGISQPVSAAPNQQATLNMPTHMVPNNWPLIPAGLGQGDSFRLLFVSQGTTDGITNGISRYNSTVANEAKRNSEFKEHMALNFRALVSVYQGLDARGNTLTRKPGVGGDPGSGSPIYWVKGQKVADDYADFYDGSWDSREARTSSGGLLLGDAIEIWTGSTHEGTRAMRDGIWSVDLGSPPAVWNFFHHTATYGLLGARHKDTTGAEINAHYGNASKSKHLYGISPLLKVRNTTGVKPIISGPTETVRGPFDAVISFPDDHQIVGMSLSDVTVSGGTASNLRHTAGAGSAAVGASTSYVVTITPDYAASIYDATTVSVSLGAGAVTDINGWKSVASDTFTVKSTYLEKRAVTIPFDDRGVGTVPRSWAFIPTADLKPGDSFRLLFVTSDTRDGDSSAIGDYNRFVQNAAARSDFLNNFSSRFRALASVRGVHAIDNSNTRGTGVPTYWVEGEKIANSYTDLYDGSWASRAGTDENGNRHTGRTDIWTGTNDDGTEAASELGGMFTARYTRLGLRSPFGNTIVSTTDKKHFYALSPVLKIAKTGGL